MQITSLVTQPLPTLLGPICPHLLLGETFASRGHTQAADAPPNSGISGFVRFWTPLTLTPHPTPKFYGGDEPRVGSTCPICGQRHMWQAPWSQSTVGLHVRCQALLKTCNLRPTEKARIFWEVLPLLCQLLTPSRNWRSWKGACGSLTQEVQHQISISKISQSSKRATAQECFILRFQCGTGCHHPA